MKTFRPRFQVLVEIPLLAWLVAIVGGITPVSARADAIVVDQQYLPATAWSGAARSIDIWGQTFRSSVGGRLMGLELDATRALNLSDPLVVTLRVLASLQPLAVVQIPANDVPVWGATNSHRLAIDFSGFRVDLVPGTDYVFDFTSPLISPPEYSIVLGCPDPQCQQDGYPAGYAHQGYVRRQEDFLFRTYMLGPDPSPRAAELVVPPPDLDCWLAEHAILHVAATGSLPLTFQWYREGTPIRDATNSTLRVQGSRAGSEVYSVSVSNRFGGALSSAARVTVHAGPEILYPPVDTDVPLGLPATMSVTAGGHGTLTYQWYREGVKVPGGTDRVLSWTPTLADSGEYWVVVAAQGSLAESTHVRLQVRDDSSRVLWKVPLYYPWAVPAVATNGEIYLVTYNRERLGILPGGAVAWRIAGSAGGGYSAPVIVEGRGVLVAASGFDISSLQDGRVVSSSPRLASITSAPVYVSEMDRVFTADDTGVVRGYSPDGSLVWQTPVSTARFVAPPRLYRHDPHALPEHGGRGPGGPGSRHGGCAMAKIRGVWQPLHGGGRRGGAPGPGGLELFGD